MHACCRMLKPHTGSSSGVSGYLAPLYPGGGGGRVNDVAALGGGEAEGVASGGIAAGGRRDKVNAREILTVILETFS